MKTMKSQEENLPAGAAIAAPLSLVHPGVVLWGRKCPECGGYLYQPKRGFAPDTCSGKCRMRRWRRLRREAEGQE